jgi:hypothetical protein
VRRVDRSDVARRGDAVVPEAVRKQLARVRVGELLVEDRSDRLCDAAVVESVNRRGIEDAAAVAAEEDVLQLHLSRGRIELDDRNDARVRHGGVAR